MSSVNPDDIAHLKIPLADVLSATNNFADKYCVGTGGFGIHYKGQLLWSGELTDIHAQRFTKEWDDEKEQQFWMEVSLLSSLKHKNVVSLVGFCDENDEKIIITRWETRGSLCNHLGDPMLLTWVKRLEICVGLAHALSYIHYDEHRDFSVIHRNIDSETVLLNDNWEPLLSQFRLSMKIKASKRHNSFCVDEVCNREGYTDPTYIETKSVSHKSDIYSFGIVMFELLCGREAVIDGDQDNKYLASVAATHYREKKLNEIIDWDLRNQMDSQSVNIFAEIAYDCLNEEPSERPNIDDIVTRLDKALELQREHQNEIMSSSKDDLAHLKIPLESILSATNNFAEENIFITGTFGNSYKGQLLWSGELININARRFNKERNGAEQELWTEISMLSSLKHKNVVSLVGFCDEKDEKVIITKYDETRGTLLQYLSDPMLLTWVRRLEISVGIAHALSYIHYDERRDFSVINRKINSSAVLLNDDWDPKLSNFEHSMKIEASQRHHSFHTNIVRYTIGYGDPTYIETKRVNHKSDIYSFGIILFELLCGRKSVSDDQDKKYLVPVATTHFREEKLNEIIDWDLFKQMDSKSFEIFAKIAYECLNEEMSQRPNINEIAPTLEEALKIARVNSHITSSPKDDLAHLKIPLESIRTATNNFDEENVIVISLYSKEYKGQFLWSGDLIDIHARRLNKKTNCQEQLFWTEISTLSSLEHKNVVSLVGFCDENDEKIIIIKLQTRGSLYNNLSDPMLLPWVRRLEISVGIAHALSYIHYDEPRDFSVIHRLISSGRVQLTDDWEPKLCDFEFSMKIKASQRHHSFHTNRLRYVEGNGDPAYIETESVSHKTDIYSFGILLFELLCGRDSISDDQDNKYLGPVAIAHFREKKLNEIIDWDLSKQMDSRSFEIFAKIAYDCLTEERSQRPNINEIAPTLEEALKIARVNSHIMSSPKDDLAHLKIPLESIHSATNNFDEENVIITSEYSKEYKGQFLWSGDLIDITARRFNKERNDREQLFSTEISMLSSLKHKNLVSIVGFCDDNDEKVIIFKSETRLSLYDHLSDPVSLTWVRRLEISVGIAHALRYIHYDEPRDFSVIHRRISSGTVLLTDEWEPKLCDFVCSMKIEATQRHHSFHTNKVEGVKGYADPTYIETKKVNHNSDMYSFGILLFELMCGRKSVSDDHLGPVAITHFREQKLNEIIDWDLSKQMDSRSFKIFTKIAYECLNEEMSQSPNIDDIVSRLEKALELARENRPIHSPPNHLAHLRIPLEDIESATNYFAEENVVGTGGFGKRYEGKLSWSGELINVIAQRLINNEWDEKEQQFWTEIAMLSGLKHKNVVSFVGYCNEVGAETIIYKRNSRGRLDGYLSDARLLTWVKRLEISVDVAHALSYIHYDEPREFSVIHRHISSYTVRLNNDWEPKLWEFQHSMKIKASERHHTFYTDSVWSTKGYTDPTCIETNIVDFKSDIYSFGIVLFELLCGRKSVSDDQDNKYLAPVATFHYREKILDGIIDPDLWKQIDPRSLNIFAETAYDCLNEERSQRPNVDEIVTRLEKALELQLQCENAEHSSVVDEVGGTSSSHEKDE